MSSKFPLGWIVAISVFGTLSVAPLISTSGNSSERGVATPSIGGIYRRSLEHEPSTLDPPKISDLYGITIAEQVFDGLVRYDANLNLAPGLAESWTASKDGLVWTFLLRKGVRFHHGREMTADDVVYSFTRLLDNRRGSKKVQLLSMVKGARAFQQGQVQRVEGLEVLNRHTVRITLEEPSGPFPAWLALGHAKILPREVVEAKGDAFGREPVGTGPFRFVRWDRSQIILEANHDYFEGRPFLDRVVYKIFAGAQYGQMLGEFLHAQLEDTTLSRDTARRMTQNYTVLHKPILALKFLGINTQKGPLKDRRIRQAMNYAINKSVSLPDVSSGYHLPSDRIIPKSLAVYHLQLHGYALPAQYSRLTIEDKGSSFLGLPYDLLKGRALLSEAGYRNGDGVAPIELWSSVKEPIAVQEDTAIQRAWGEVGLKVVIRYNTDWPSYVRDLEARKLSLYRYAWYADVPDPDDFLFNLFHSQGQRNYMDYRNPVVDDLLIEARRERAVDRRMALYRTAEQIILNDAPLVPLVHYIYHRVLQPYVKGFEVNALGDPYVPMRKVWLDKR